MIPFSSAKMSLKGFELKAVKVRGGRKVRGNYVVVEFHGQGRKETRTLYEGDTLSLDLDFDFSQR